MNLLADEVDVALRQVFLDIRQVALLGLGRELLALDLLLEHVQQVHRIGRHFGIVEIEHLRQNLESKAGRQAVHAFVHARVIDVFVQRLGFGVGVFQVVAVIHEHLGIDAGIVGILQAREHGKLRHHAQRARGAGRLVERRIAQQLVVDFHFVRHPQAIRHLDNIDAVEERLVIAVVAEGLPFGLVRVRQHDAVERNRAKAFGALVIAFLRGREQRVQHLDRRLEHLDEFHQALIGQAQAARIAVGIRIVLREILELADIDLADEGRDILVVFVARFGLGNGDLLEDRRVAPHDAELVDVAAEFVQALDGPGTRHRAQIAAGNAVILFEDLAVFVFAEQAQGRLVDGRTLDCIKGHQLHQALEFFGNRRFAATDRPQ